MAKGREAHQARLAAVAGLGRWLNRRAKSHCELCQADSGLKPVEVPPTEDEPSPERAVFVCPRCADLVEGGRLPKDTDSLRFLADSVWSEVPVVQVAAVRLLDRLVADEVRWAEELREQLWLDEPVQEWLESA